MLYLAEIVESLGRQLKTCLGLDSPINTIAKKVYKDGKKVLVSGDNILCPSNDCELDGFIYLGDKIPIYADRNFGCMDQITGFEIPGYLMTYGRKECGLDWQGALCKCLSSVSGQEENENWSLRVMRITDDIPDIISSHFGYLQQEFQDAQPCTTLIKSEFKLEINIC